MLKFLKILYLCNSASSALSYNVIQYKRGVWILCTIYCIYNKVYLAEDQTYTRTVAIFYNRNRLGFHVEISIFWGERKVLHAQVTASAKYPRSGRLRLRNTGQSMCIIHRRRIQKQRQRSSRLFGGQDLSKSLPR